VSFDAVPDPANVTNTNVLDYFTEVALGNVTGVTSNIMLARNLSTAGTIFETIWDQGGNITYLSADTQLFISSSSASDTDVDVVVLGLDNDYLEVARTVTTNGQTQVALSGLMRFPHIAAVVDVTSAVGELYLAESDTLTAGVPDTVSKIKAKIPLTPNDSGDFASNGISHNGFRTIPAGKKILGIELSNSTAKNDDLTVELWLKIFGGVWQSLGINWLYQSLAVLPFPVRFGTTEKSQLEFRVLGGTAGDKIDLQLELLLIDD